MVFHTSLSKRRIVAMCAWFSHLKRSWMPAFSSFSRRKSSSCVFNCKETKYAKILMFLLAYMLILFTLLHGLWFKSMFWLLSTYFDFPVYPGCQRFFHARRGIMRNTRGCKLGGRRAGRTSGTLLWLLLFWLSHVNQTLANRARTYFWLVIMLGVYNRTFERWKLRQNVSISKQKIKISETE
jgi:hypothetical protein